MKPQTCRRISAKILRNIVNYYQIIVESTNTTKFNVLRLNQEEFLVQGSEGIADRRIVNSYPSKVLPIPRLTMYLSTHPTNSTDDT